MPAAGSERNKITDIVKIRIKCINKCDSWDDKSKIVQIAQM